MSNRKSKFGPKPASSHAQSVALTREYLAAQPAGAEFTRPPETRQWKCACGYVNPIRRQNCRQCGKAVAA